MNTMTLADAITFHHLTLASEGRTETTQRQYAYFQSVFLRYLESRGLPTGLDALNVTNVRDALAWYQARPDFRRRRGGEVASQTFIDTMKLWANFLEREGVLLDSPLAKLRRVKIAKRLRQPFTQTEIIALWGACKQSQNPLRDEVLFLLLLDTGMRIGEACTLMVGHVRLDERVIVVGGSGKGRRERLVPIGQQAKRDGGRTIRALRAYLDQRRRRRRPVCPGLWTASAAPFVYRRRPRADSRLC
jgi:site-specific recombinase XerD